MTFNNKWLNKINCSLGSRDLYFKLNVYYEILQSLWRG